MDAKQQEEFEFWLGQGLFDQGGSGPLKEEPRKFVTALDRQEGEQAYHTPYRSFPIQPVEFLQKNKIGWCEANAIKYLCRFRSKNGLEDLKKARHYIELLIEMEYGEQSNKNVDKSQ